MYAFFNKEVGQIIQKSAQKHVQVGLNKGLDTYNDYRFDHNGNNQTFFLRYTGSNTLSSNDIAPSFGFFKYPFITVFPRSIISPIVLPSAGTGCMVSGSTTWQSPAKT